MASASPVDVAGNCIVYVGKSAVLTAELENKENGRQLKYEKGEAMLSPDSFLFLSTKVLPPDASKLIIDISLAHIRDEKFKDKKLLGQGHIEFTALESNRPKGFGGKFRLLFLDGGMLDFMEMFLALLYRVRYYCPSKPLGLVYKQVYGTSYASAVGRGSKKLAEKSVSLTD
eukprot:CAMPEP_0196662876 /NCGR_PEP_ID=MMETSP1086-20130531/50663_1 /TAXON_ID=77921 /ORGANISM="Cyanoptyche  gloeocystis , Strain SAG4.97" /LENGTH=171 /DNA_ID=CAMNT_0041998487 /DNA_START=68 /DNA_END=584 /DNA_ORIENTATION=-